MNFSENGRSEVLEVDIPVRLLVRSSESLKAKVTPFKHLK